MALPETELDESERRIAPRMRVLKRAKIFFNNGFSTFDCVVRNVSATGALLTLAESAHMPKEFQIKIGDDPVRPAKLVYRRTMFAGVRYSDIPDEDEEREGLEPVAKKTPSPAPQASPSASAPMPTGRPNGVEITKLKGEALPAAVVCQMPWNR